MSDGMYNIFSAVGICLTFLVSLSAVIVSIISLRYTHRAAKYSAYLNTITSSRYKWTSSLRVCASLYFTQIIRICNEKDENLEEIYNELTRYHFAIILLLSEKDVELHNQMSIVRNKAAEIVRQDNLIKVEYKKNEGLLSHNINDVESQELVIKARQTIRDLRVSIMYEYQDKIFNSIIALLESEWEKQKYEAENIN
mgnify:CR=1 FL=1